MAEVSTSELLRKIPAVSRILELPEAAELLERFPRGLLLRALNEVLNGLRDRLRQGSLTEAELEGEIRELIPRLERLLADWTTLALRPLINATGVILFTNAGRAPLAPQAAEYVSRIATAYSNLEFNLETGNRGRRDSHFEAEATRLFRCEAATVCNNGAAAVFLILDTLAAGRKVIVSRGELIEIGGSFRIPEILVKSGAQLCEVGTTNKTRISDYAAAVDHETALILRVHPSNYKIIGFTERPELEELVSLARSTGIPLVHDLGSGSLYPGSHPFLYQEPAVETSLQSGVDLLCFSGDKLLGGPQAGLILGRKSLVDRIRKNPLMRICRADKMTYAALEWTLLQYQIECYQKTIPVWRMVNASREEVSLRCRELMSSAEGSGLQFALQEGFSVTGGGSAPEEQIPTVLVAVSSERLTVNQLEHRLRLQPFPVLGRIEENRLLLDLRTVLPDQDQELAAALRRVAQ